MKGRIKEVGKRGGVVEQVWKGGSWDWLKGCVNEAVVVVFVNGVCVCVCVFV